ncbi:MAG: PepSY domain-containing protein [Rhodanobacter sp.]
MNIGRNKALSLIVCLLAFAGVALAQSAAPTVTLNQAVIQVQQDTGGKVLSAEPHRLGRRLEYRVKVLTPKGHVQVISVPSEAGKKAVSNQSTKSPPTKSVGNKENY